MKQRILSGWNFVRVLWLVMGIGISIQAVTERNYLMLFPALYFVFAAIANIGCCASGGCATNFNNNNSKKESITEIEYKEIQSKD
jgi:hypothetical protein